MPFVFFSMFWLNAFDSPGGWFILDVPALNDPEILKCTTLAARREDPHAGNDLPRCRLLRISIPVENPDPNAKVIVREIDPPETGGYFSSCTCNPRYSGQPYRFAYGLCIHERPSNNCTAVCRINLETAETLTWHEEGLLPSCPPVFVPRPGACDEDDGVLVVDFAARDGTGVLLFLCGRTLTEVARARIPQALPVGLRCTFFPFDR